MGIVYSAPPFRMVYRGLGEAVVALAFGPLITVGAYYVQTGSFSPAPFYASMPVAFLIAAVLMINEFPDYEADKKAGKNQLVVKLGPDKAVRVYGLIVAFAYASILIGVLLGAMPFPALIGVLTIFQAKKAYNLLCAHHSRAKKLVGFSKISP
jgi:1,4-dihydroxy-2-naphthoate octaprenyltransferase